MYPVYLVTGTGRCGSSTVARVMHEKLNINMGLLMAPETDQNPGGLYEDLEFHLLNNRLFHDNVTFQQWFSLTWDLIKTRLTDTPGPWGFKEMFSSYLLGSYLAMFPETPRIIWVRRTQKLVVRSIQENWGLSTNDAIDTYRGREWACERILKYIPHLQIKFSKKRKGDHEIIDSITSKWSDVIIKE